MFSLLIVSCYAPLRDQQYPTNLSKLYQERKFIKKNLHKRHQNEQKTEKRKKNQDKNLRFARKYLSLFGINLNE